MEDKLSCHRPKCGWTGPPDDAICSDIGGTVDVFGTIMHMPDYVYLCPICHRELDYVDDDDNDDDNEIEMSDSKKYYKQAAETIAGTARKLANPSDRVIVMANLIAGFSDIFSSMSNRFNRDKFQSYTWSIYHWPILATGFIRVNEKQEMNPVCEHCISPYGFDKLPDGSWACVDCFTEYHNS